MNRTWVQVGSLAGFLAVALGAFGAHALKQRLGPLAPVWETAVHYQMFHALALLFLGLAAPHLPEPAVRRIGALFSAGIVLFSGSLYVLALTDVQVLGAITPFGGLCFLVGWVYLAFAAGNPDRAAGPPLP